VGRHYSTKTAADGMVNMPVKTIGPFLLRGLVIEDNRLNP
jgi:hypothetical protein